MPIIPSPSTFIGRILVILSPGNSWCWYQTYFKTFSYLHELSPQFESFHLLLPSSSPPASQSFHSPFSQSFWKKRIMHTNVRPNIKLTSVYTCSLRMLNIKPYLYNTQPNRGLHYIPSFNLTFLYFSLLFFILLYFTLYIVWIWYNLNIIDFY